MTKNENEAVQLQRVHQPVKELLQGQIPGAQVLLARHVFRLDEKLYDPGSDRFVFPGILESTGFACPSEDHPMISIKFHTAVHTKVSFDQGSVHMYAYGDSSEAYMGIFEPERKAPDLSEHVCIRTASRVAMTNFQGLEFRLVLPTARLITDTMLNEAAVLEDFLVQALVGDLENASSNSCMKEEIALALDIKPTNPNMRSPWMDENHFMLSESGVVSRRGVDPDDTSLRAVFSDSLIGAEMYDGDFEALWGDSVNVARAVYFGMLGEKRYHPRDVIEESWVRRTVQDKPSVVNLPY